MSTIFLAQGDSFRLTLGSAAAVDVAIFYNGGRVLKSYAAAATVDVMDAISNCEIETILITNKDGSTACTVTPAIHTRDGLQGVIDLYPATALTAGQALAWSNGTWLAPAASTKLDSLKVVPTNSVHATAATFALVTGLSWPVAAGHHYAIDARLMHAADAATTGAQFGLGGVAMTSMNFSGMDIITISVTASTVGSGTAAAVDTAAIVETASAAGNAVLTGIFYGDFIPSADGTVELRATSEVTVAAGLTVYAGSWAWVREFD